MCCYAGIRSFERDTKLPLSIWVYSHTLKQKIAGFTLVVLATITLIVGACFGCSLSAAASWAMISVSAGVISITLGVMTLKHLYFVNQVSRFLATQRGVQEWVDENNYPYAYDSDDSMNIFAPTIDDKTIYGSRYQYLTSVEPRYIEFHASINIHNERVRLPLR